MAAVVRTGSFDKAAQSLNVTPSAVSQRVKLLEDRLGVVLVVRGHPCRATEAGRRLCRHADDVGLMEQQLRRDLGMAAPMAARLRVAVNADSLATWFIDAMAACDGFLFDLVLDDQDHSADWLRRGEVSAAVTAHAGGVQGAGSRPLGALRYIATASPDFIRRWFADGVTIAALRQAPCLYFDRKDELQGRWIAELTGERVTTPNHWLPSTQAFVDGARAGLGWGMNPLALVQADLDAGRLLPLVPGRPFDVPLFWQWSRAVEVAIAPVTQAVRQAAARALLPAPPCQSGGK